MKIQFTSRSQVCIYNKNNKISSVVVYFPGDFEEIKSFKKGKKTSMIELASGLKAEVINNEYEIVN